MRVLLVSRFGHRIGGIEVHLQGLIPALEGRGHEVRLLHGEPVPPGAELVAAPELTLGLPVVDSLRALRAWRPEVVYAHDRIDSGSMEALVARHPAVWFAHAYAGLCVSGSRCWKAPVPRPCRRALGWLCLLHYLPHRCGGWNPWTMWRLFRAERASLRLLRRFDRIATHAENLRREFLRHGFDGDVVRVMPFPVRGLSQRSPASGGGGARPGIGDPFRLLFLGRFDVLKGGAVLLRALPEIARRLDRPLDLVMAGSGPEEARWRRLAEEASTHDARVRVRFPGWLGDADRGQAIRESDLLVMPSVWPEPFGMTGIEAAHAGVPAVAFDVGGIRAWLEAGVSGELAPGDPPTARGLAEAVARAGGSPDHHRRLCRGAVEQAGRFSMARHLEALEALLREAVAARSEPATGRTGRPGGEP